MKKNNENKDLLGRKYVNILGINVTSTEVAEVLAGVNDFIAHNSEFGDRNSKKTGYNKKFSIVTPNPELVLSSEYNAALKKALNSADFAVPDGIGLAQAARFLTLKAPKNFFLRTVVSFYQGILVGGATLVNKSWLTTELNIVKGRKLFEELIKLAERKRWKVLLLGGKDNEADAAARKLQYKYNKLRVLSVKGPKLNQNAEPMTEVDKKIQKDVIDVVNTYSPEVLFVAFGNPKQEIWIQKNMAKLKIGGAMAVGGTFRYIAGLSKLPPQWMGNLGLEWLWRVLTEPVRLRRIWNAVVVFPWKVFIYKISH